MNAIEQALLRMKEKGYKNTPKRQAMLDIIASENKFISARQVQEKLTSTYAGLSYDTVYRNLYTFVELGILEMSEKNGEKVFLMHCFAHEHHHHFICDSCGEITELHTCPMELFEQQLPNYHILGHRFEITGLCAHCVTDSSSTIQQNDNTDDAQAGCCCGHHHV